MSDPTEPTTPLPGPDPMYPPPTPDEPGVPDPEEPLRPGPDEPPLPGAPEPII